MNTRQCLKPKNHQQQEISNQQIIQLELVFELITTSINKKQEDYLTESDVDSCFGIISVVT